MPLEPSGRAVKDGAWLCPVGDWIYFAASRDGRRDVYVIDADGSGLARLTNDSGAGVDVARIR